MEDSNRMSEAFQNFVNRESKKQRPRTVGSCRFSPYFKAQWFDEKTLSWRDIQKRYDTLPEAEAEFTKAKKWRVMEISMKGQRVL